MNSELAARLITALVGIPILLALVFWTPDWGFALLVAAASGVAIWEYCSITYPSEHPFGRFATVGAGLLLTATLFFAPLQTPLVLCTLAIGLWFVFLFGHRDREDSSPHVAFSITGLLYGGLILGLIVPLHQSPLGPWWVILTMVTVWASDSGAYFGGSALGSRPLYPSVSPNKSIEGSIAGILGSTAGFALCNWAIFPALSPWTPLSWWLCLGIVIPGNLLAQTGDLAESLVKRAHDVDDSGKILYGHGGILDRIDGLIFAVPWFYLCAVEVMPALGLSP